MITVLVPGEANTAITAIPNGVMIGTTKAEFYEFHPDLVYAQNKPITAVSIGTGESLLYDELSLARPQGDIGLFVPDAGYPFGPMPDWLIRARSSVPSFAPGWVARMRRESP